jgi:hypothetical protein
MTGRLQYQPERCPSSFPSCPFCAKKFHR